MSACDLSQMGLVDSERVPSSCRPKSCKMIEMEGRSRITLFHYRGLALHMMNLVIPV